MPPENAQVLEFGLESERYCAEIEHVDEIVGRDDITSLPNTSSHVLGAMDLRGETIVVLDPKVPFGVDGSPGGDRILVLNESLGEENEQFGWLVDSVHDVLSVSADDIDDSVENESDGVYGTLRRDERLIVWVDPETVITYESDSSD